MDVQIPCLCPAKPDGTPRHESDTVVLRDRLDFRTTLVIRQSVKWLKETDPGFSMGEALATLSETYALHCIESWTLTDERGKAVPPSRNEITSRLLEREDPGPALTVTDAADSLYSERILLPLLGLAPTSSGNTPTATSTSAKSGRGRTRRMPSKRSSISTSPTVVTGTMAASPVGGSSSSPNSASAR